MVSHILSRCPPSHGLFIANLFIALYYVIHLIVFPQVLALMKTELQKVPLPFNFAIGILREDINEKKTFSFGHQNSRFESHLRREISTT